MKRFAEGPLDDERQCVRSNRAREKAVGAALQCFDGGVCGAVFRHRDERGGRKKGSGSAAGSRSHPSLLGPGLPARPRQASTAPSALGRRCHRAPSPRCAQSPRARPSSLDCRAGSLSTIRSRPVCSSAMIRGWPDCGGSSIPWRAHRLRCILRAKEQVLHSRFRGLVRRAFRAATARGGIRGGSCWHGFVLLARPISRLIGALKGDETMTEDREIKNYEKLAERARTMKTYPKFLPDHFHLSRVQYGRVCWL